LPFLPAVKPERDRRLDVACVWTFLLIQLSENTARNGQWWYMGVGLLLKDVVIWAREL